MAEGANPEWIAVDWGTSRLRAWAMRGAEVVGEAQSDLGMGAISTEAFPGVLADLTAAWRRPGATLPVIACGMVGAREGWVQAPYRPVPCTPLAPEAAVAVRAPGLDVRILPGLSQREPADVMRGEETQVAGFLAAQPQFDGVICLPGTHSKWVRVSAGEVVSFATYVTGELFALLADASVLRHSLAGGGFDAAAFDHGAEEGRARPERVQARLFGLRAAALLEGEGATSLRSHLSGLLIGAEIASARGYWLGQPAAVIGAAPLADLYRRTLAAEGADALLADATEMTLAGLTAAHVALGATICAQS
ncbi:MAG: 2-dehydro-3-deoxygalactonokinase [Pseudomonadota bacterium]